MIIDTHVHVWSYPVLEEHGSKIYTTEDLMAFRTRYPDLYERTLTEAPVDNSDTLVAQMDERGIAKAMVQARPGEVTNDQVAQSVRRHPDRLYGLFRIGHDQEAAHEYVDDPGPVREAAPDHITYCVEELGMIGMGEMFVRAFTRELDPEAIARDLTPIMERVAHHGIPIQIPTAWSQFPGGLIYGDPIWTDEIACRWPDTPVILTKMGRSVQTYFDHALVVAMRNQNVILDVVGTRPDHLRQAIDAIGSKRILFGTDWSATWRWVRKPADLYSLRLGVLDKAGLTEEEHEDILWRNAVRVFKLDDIDMAAAAAE
jgi:predicted TIM-barrel fold metal-dependent hydrolase